MFAGNFLDDAFLQVLRYLFGLRMTVVNAMKLNENRLSHGFDLGSRINICLLHNSNAAMGHYSCIGMLYCCCFGDYALRNSEHFCHAISHSEILGLTFI